MPSLLRRNFFARSVHVVAPDLIGATLLFKGGGGGGHLLAAQVRLALHPQEPVAVVGLGGRALEHQHQPDLLEQAGVVAGIEHDIDAQRIERPRIGHLVCRHEVAATHFDLVQTQPLGDRIHQALPHERRLETSGRAVCAARCLVGQPVVTRRFIRGDAVRPEQ